MQSGYSSKLIPSVSALCFSQSSDAQQCLNSTDRVAGLFLVSEKNTSDLVFWYTLYCLFWYSRTLAPKLQPSLPPFVFSLVKQELLIKRLMKATFMSLRWRVKKRNLGASFDLKQQGETASVLCCHNTSWIGSCIIFIYDDSPFSFCGCLCNCLVT